jgi:hypothetical protein
MDIGPTTAERAIADTRRLMKEGFVVVTVEGARMESAWNFLFFTPEESVSFRKSMSEIAVLYPDGRVADRVIENIALNYETVRYSFKTAAGALRFFFWTAEASSAH